MSRKASSIVAVAVAAAVLGVSLVATSVASAGNQKIPILEWVVTGSVTAKKLNQTITLPPGSEFEGVADLELNEGFEHIHGTIVRERITVPPFRSTLTVLGVPTPVEVGITFSQAGEQRSTITSLPRTACGFTQEQYKHAVGCLEVKAPVAANVGFTGAFALGLGLPTHCETATPVVIAARDVLGFRELLYNGIRASGTVTIPSIRCDGLQGLALGPVLTLALSGPDNPYQFAISPPPTLQRG